MYARRSSVSNNQCKVAAVTAQVKDTDLKLETAMSLYGLRKFELLWERKLDSKALIAWNDDTVVLAFRGTASLANLWADLQVRSCMFVSPTRCLLCLVLALLSAKTKACCSGRNGPLVTNRLTLDLLPALSSQNGSAE
jgi:hypothetical protein